MNIRRSIEDTISFMTCSITEWQQVKSFSYKNVIKIKWRAIILLIRGRLKLQAECSIPQINVRWFPTFLIWQLIKLYSYYFQWLKLQGIYIPGELKNRALLFGKSVKNAKQMMWFWMIRTAKACTFSFRINLFKYRSAYVLLLHIFLVPNVATRPIPIMNEVLTHHFYCRYQKYDIFEYSSHIPIQRNIHEYERLLGTKVNHSFILNSIVHINVCVSVMF